MHSDADFLAAVAANPHDPLTRLVYADWLDEQGDPRGELVRIEEEVRFEPAWSEVLWSQKPRRNELRAKCDPAWLAAMRYGTDCLPLFYGRPFPDHWRDGWRLIREATERWLGVPMPDIGGHADEVAAVEKRLGLTLPPSVREFVAFAHDLPQPTSELRTLLNNIYAMSYFPKQEVLSLLTSYEGDIHFSVQFEEMNLADPPVTTFLVEPTATEDASFSRAVDERVPLTRFLFLDSVAASSRLTTSVELEIQTLHAQLEAVSQSWVALGRSTWFESRNLFMVLTSYTPDLFGAPGDRTTGYLDVRGSRSLKPEDAPGILWEVAGPDAQSNGIFLEQVLRLNPSLQEMA